jgi:hypothetical protein
MAIDYGTQSVASAPEGHRWRFDTLRLDLAGVSQTVQGLIYHYAAGKHFFGYEPPSERIAEIDSRSVTRILDRLIAMDDRPLDQPRSYADRVVGCCRDFALLACSILRHHGTPARLRYGFATYFEQGYPGDHVIVEVWSGDRWRRFDPQLAGVSNFGVDLLDIPSSAFLTGSEAWIACRAGADPSRFGLGQSMPEVSGLWFVRGRMQLDLAALRKQELLCWDSWSYGLESAALLPSDEALLDRVARLSIGCEAELLVYLNNEPRLALPHIVTSMSPALGEHMVSIASPR